jgi:hypothetical protein
MPTHHLVLDLEDETWRPCEEWLRADQLDHG